MKNEIEECGWPTVYSVTSRVTEMKWLTLTSMGNTWGNWHVHTPPVRIGKLCLDIYLREKKAQINPKAWIWEFMATWLVIITSLEPKMSQLSSGKRLSKWVVLCLVQCNVAQLLSKGDYMQTMWFQSLAC